ncbi:hypothetical protein [Arthrobacter sp. H5]|uniref:hypothetical protein n=1 Tax=Arthrobacter sp. H5 TaxID=1267973 RepID=UPI0004881868|nr:hypothetical protein [Arthrobacter sp. H5]
MGIFVLAVLFTQGGILRKPFLLPTPLMHKQARARFAIHEEWESALSPREALDTIADALRQPGVVVRRIGPSVLIQLSKDWRPKSWRRADAL